MDKKIENQARQEAIADAIKKAESIAQAGNFKLGKILSISENSSPIFYRASKSFGISANEDAMISPTIEPGSQEITIGITINYEIK